MSIVLNNDQSVEKNLHERIGLECPHCTVFAHMSPQSVPDAAALLRDRPSHVGLVYQCDACREPVFLKFTVRSYDGNRVELLRNFVELERPKERFAYSYLPKDTAILFREALSCYSQNNFNAFAIMCRRAAASAYRHIGEGGKLRAFEEVIAAQELAAIDDESFAPIKTVLFGAGQIEDIPLIRRREAAILLEIVRDLFYQCFVRQGKLTRALKVRQFFVDGRDEQDDDIESA